MQKVFLEIKRRKKLYLSYKRQLGTAPVQTNAITKIPVLHQYTKFVQEQWWEALWDWMLAMVFRVLVQVLVAAEWIYTESYSEPHRTT